MAALLAVGVVGAIPEPTPSAQAMNPRRHAGDNVGAVVWLPLETSAQNQPGPRSEARYTLETTCPAGTWRWTANGRQTKTAIEVATALIIRVECAGMSVSHEALLASAGESLSTAFRVDTGFEAVEAEGLAIRFPGARDAPRALLGQWESQLDDRAGSATEALARAISELAPSELTLTAIVAREHVDAASAPIEVCENGRWQAGGDRVVSARRSPLPPFFHGPLTASAADGGGAAQSAGQLVRALLEWLRINYADEAAAAAILAHGGDLTAPAGVEPITAQSAKETPSED